MTSGRIVDAVVIGAGVSGLTTAVCLAEAGLRVRIIAKDPPLSTTSAVAGASWSPYLAADPRMVGWSHITRMALASVATAHPEAGVRLVRGLEANAGSTDPPTWARLVPDFSPADKPPDGYQAGWWFTAPVVDMQLYLPYLEARLARCGVSIEIDKFDVFDQAHELAPIVVNCTGLGSRELAGDRLVHAVRGQLVILPNPGIDYFFQENGAAEEFTYFTPHSTRLVLGGCALPHDESLEPDEDLAARIVERCVAIEPRLRDLPVLELRTGLRPNRVSVRLEIDLSSGQPVIHNYGHGGSGLTLSWGCAATVLGYARALLRHRVARGAPPLPRLPSGESLPSSASAESLPSSARPGPG
jgi:D-amino-acid oxidase